METREQIALRIAKESDALITEHGVASMRKEWIEEFSRRLVDELEKQKERAEALSSIKESEK